MTSNQKTSSRVPACLEMELESQVRGNGYKNTYSEVMISSLVVLGRVMEIIRHSNLNHGFFIGVDEIVQSHKKRGWIAPTSDPSRTVLMMPVA